ncbi:MAG TPA: CBS domain-containing protein [Candidatus Binatia bacterium]|jgi:CBS domain-containing protein
MDWLAFGLPAEGDEKPALLVNHIDRRVPTCRVPDPVERARQNAAAMGFTICPVINEGNVVLGLIRGNGSEGDPAAAVGEIMEFGPKTLRPGSSVQEARKIAEKNGWTEILVTSSDGKLLGIFKAGTKKEQKSTQ